MPSDQERFSTVMLVTSIACIALLLTGIAFLISPFYIKAGMIGLLQGYEPKTDVLGLVWLMGTFGSMFIGVILVITAAVSSASLGLVAAFTGTRSKAKPSVVPQKSPKVEDTSAADE